MKIRDRIRLALLRLRNWAVGKHEDGRAGASQLAVERMQREGREKAKRERQK